MLDETLINAARAACEAQTVRELADVAAGHVRHALDAANVLLFSFSPQGLQGEGGELSSALSVYTAELFEEDIIQQAVLRAQCVATPTVPTEWPSFDLRAHKRSAAYADFYRPFDIEHIICVHLNDLPYGSDGMRGMLFCRSGRQEPFCQTDVARITSVAPFLRAARGRIELFEQTKGKLRALEAIISQLSDRPALLLDEQAQVLWVSQGAERVLWRHGRLESTSLPAGLLRATEGFLARARGTGVAADWVDLAPKGAEPLRAQLELIPLANGQRTVLVRLAQEREATASPTSATAGHSARAAGRSQRGGPAELPAPPAPATRMPGVGLLQETGSTWAAPVKPTWSRHAVASLTPAEREVLTLLRHGLDNRTIAQRRSVSLETVRTHVRRILSKLGVANRSQAALIAQALSGRGEPF